MTDAFHASDLPAPTPVLAELAERVALAAAELVRSARTADLAVGTKSTPTDLVTEVDRASDALIRRLLQEARPEDGILTEEDETVTGTSGIVWVCDPIDGTVNFVHGLSPYAVSVAATLDGTTPVAGAVVEVAHGERFVAAAGHGATLDGRPIRCRQDVPLHRALVGTGYAYDRGRRRRQAAVAARVVGEVADLRRNGAAAVDLCSVAVGRLAAYYEHGLGPWDLAAGQLIAVEAGARVEAIEGGPPRPDSILAAPADLLGPLREVLLEAGAADV